MILAELVTGNLTLNPTAALKQCRAVLEGWSLCRIVQETKDGRAIGSCFALIGAHQCVGMTGCLTGGFNKGR